MVGLRERGKTLENLYFHDEEISFRVQAMQNKLIGLWAAAIMQKNDATAYAEEVVSAALAGKDRNVVFQKLRNDFDTAGVSVQDDDIHTRMSDLLSYAADDLRRGLSDYSAQPSKVA
jgi:hypothetical protein